MFRTTVYISINYRFHLNKYVCMYVCIYLGIYVCMYVCKYVCIGYSPSWRQLWAYISRDTSKVTIVIAHAPWYQYVCMYVYVM